LQGASRAVAVSHGGELLGALSLQKPRNEPLTSTEDELLQDLASQAGLVLRNAALIDELRASRRRLVGAQDAERRKIERNLHDGAQQQLIALTIQVGLLEESADDPAAVRQLAPTVRDGLRAALEDLRDLARGIYPPLLADQGLVAALQAQARKAALPVEIDADGIGRYPQDTEAAVYFCTLEALQNITKYAGASRDGRPLVLRREPPVHRHRRRGRLRHRQHPAWHRPARNGRPASRARRRPPGPLTTRTRHHPDRPTPCFHTRSELKGRCSAASHAHGLWAENRPLLLRRHRN
jgi:Histidine kinase